MREIKFRCWYENEMYHWDLLKDDAPCLDYLKSSQVMQYTGLKDKNGVEIYEGDIVSFNTLSSMKDKMFRVVEFVGTCWFPFSDGMFCDDEQGDWFYGDGFEVIGNIHQNPELLK